VLVPLPSPLWPGLAALVLVAVAHRVRSRRIERRAALADTAGQPTIDDR
jgi:hypothetical protein